MQTAMIASESTPSLFTLFFFETTIRESLPDSPSLAEFLWKWQSYERGKKKAVLPQTSLLSHFHNTRTSQPSFFFICCCSYLTTYLRTSSTATTLSGLWKRGEKQHTESAGSGERVLQQVEETGQKKSRLNTWQRNTQAPQHTCATAEIHHLFVRRAGWNLWKARNQPTDFTSRQSNS